MTKDEIQALAQRLIDSVSADFYDAILRDFIRTNSFARPTGNSSDPLTIGE